MEDKSIKGSDSSSGTSEESTKDNPDNSVKPSQKNKSNSNQPIFFEREEKIISNAIALNADPQHKENPIIDSFQNITQEYQRLLRQTQKLVKIGDSLQLNLNKLTEEKTEAYNKINTMYQEILDNLNFAQRIQTDILPKNLDRLDGVDFVIKFLPMVKVGGDIYDIARISEHCIRVFIADATGHGLQAALITMLIKSEYDMVKRQSVSPAESFNILNKRFMELFYTLNLFFTGVIVDFDLQNNSICFASAGHPTQYLIKGDELIKMEYPGCAIGIVSKSSVKETEFSIETGDKLILFTDGVLELTNARGEEYGEDRLEQRLLENISLPLKGITDKVFTDLDDHLDGASPNDDITFVGISIN